MTDPTRTEQTRARVLSLQDRVDWIGLTALVLAIALGGGWASAVVVSALHPEPISEGGLQFLNNLGQTLATGVVAFLGYKVGAEASTARFAAASTNSRT